MPVYKREYSREGKPTWYYQFFHDGRKHVKAGFRSQKDAKQAERARQHRRGDDGCLGHYELADLRGAISG